MTEQELLAVLDKSEDEQRAEIAKRLSIKPFKHDWGFSNAVGGSDNIAIGEAWVCRKCGHEEIYKRIKNGQYIPAVLDKQSSECGLPDPITESLADLAFRWRDELATNWVKYTESLTTVWAYWCNSTYVNRHSKGESKKHIKYRKFWMFYAQPIHWIIAALIVKDKENENNT